ncbi:MAG TPA: hypothetical protein VE980_20490 [Pyrinomonadaceae bacterium]|nr:hypothetical protein [Pyrinomonadaceae bacterium]
MPALEISLLTFTASQLEIKVKNTSGGSLDKVLVIELQPPMYLVSDELSEAAKDAAVSTDPPGAKNLQGIVSGPEGWSVWARRETSDSSTFIMFINGLNVSAENLTPTRLAAEAEFTIRIPLDPGANRDNVSLLYSYKHDTDQKELPVTGSLVLNSDTTWAGPDVTLTTDHKTPTAIDPKDPVKVKWTIKDGVSATLRGPLPGGNTELTLSSDPDADFKIAEGALDVHVVGPMTYLLQAEVKRPDGKPNVQVVRMLSLDKSKGKHLYLEPRPAKVLPHGLIEIDWTAWGVKTVQLSVSGHTTRNITLTRQTLGRFFEGTGVMRVSASADTSSETIQLTGEPDAGAKTKLVSVIRWVHMTKPDFSGIPLGMAVMASKLALLTTDGLHIAEVGTSDPQTALKKLPFARKTPDGTSEWGAVTAVDNRFVCLRRQDNSSPDYEFAPYSITGDPDDIPPVTLPPDARNLALHPKRTFNLVGFGKRAYLAIEVNGGQGIMRRAFSVRFDRDTKKADLRSEPLLEWMLGYRMVSFDDALYALSRESGRMFRFEINASGELDLPREAAAAVKEIENAKQESMVQKGFFVAVGGVLVVMNPTSYPTVASLEKYGLHNVLSYSTSQSPDDDPNSIPQDLVYNPQKNYWARCGHDLNIRDDAVAAFRGGASPRLWVVQPSGETYTLAVGSETLFSHNYRRDFPSEPLQPYTTKKRMFSIKCDPVIVGPINEGYRRQGLIEFTTADPTAEKPQPLMQPAKQFAVHLRYNEANPAPVTIRQQVARTRTSRPDMDYLFEVSFSGPDLSTATSCFRRVANIGGRFTNEEVFGTRLVHSTYSTIEVPRPRRFEEKFKLYIVNSSKNFRIRTSGLTVAGPYVVDQLDFGVDHDIPDFSLEFEGKFQTHGRITVNLNSAMPHGIEASRSNQAQTRFVRLNTDVVGDIQIVLLKVLLAGDPPLQIPGTAKIEPMPDRPVCVCQLDYKSPIPV